MSVGLILYIAERSQLENPVIVPIHMITLRRTLLTMYFYNGGGEKHLKHLQNTKLCVFTRDDEEERHLDKNPYDENFQYCDSEIFYDIPKGIMKCELITSKAAIKFIRKLRDHIVILDYI